MCPFLSKTVLFVGRSYVRSIAKTYGNVCSLRWFSVGSECNEQQSYTVSYLINSLGFSLKDALSASKQVKFDCSNKPGKAVEFLRNYGFTSNQISRLVRSFPKSLVTNTEKTILPKLEFLVCKGISRPELVKCLCIYPRVLTCSLGNQLIPSFEYMRALFGSDERTVEAVRRFPNILACNVERYFVPNVATLREHGVPESNIATLAYNWPSNFLKSSVRFREIVKEVERMGFDPSKLNFFIATSAMLNNTKFDRKVSLYKKWGWSDTEVSGAFLRSPWYLLTSEDKITKCMGFFTAKMGLKPCDLAKFPEVFNYSLEKRVIPRVLFYQTLLSKGLVKKQVSLSTLIVISEKKFLRQFVAPFVEESPELLKLYDEIYGLSSRPESGKVSK